MVENDNKSVQKEDLHDANPLNSLYCPKFYTNFILHFFA